MANVSIPLSQELLDDLAKNLALEDLGSPVSDAIAAQRAMHRTSHPSLLAEWPGPPMPKKLNCEIRSKEHPPPHFHVERDGEEASFSILDGTRLPGVVGLERYDSVIRNWWEEHRRELCLIWNKSRPTDCTVGPVPVPPPPQPN
jgi:hypothetical protein